MTDWMDKLNKFNEGFFDLPENRLPGAHTNLDRKVGDMVSGRDREVKQDAATPHGTSAEHVDDNAPHPELLDETKDLFREMIEIDQIEGVEIGKMVDKAFPHEAAEIRAEMQTEHVESELARLWHDKFDRHLRPELVAEIEDGGNAWKMDRKGNFILKMKGGKKLFVGYKKTADGRDPELLVQKRGGGFSFTKLDAYHMMLGQRSLGRKSISLTYGTKKHKAMMWAAAKLLDIDVKGYEPDRRALKLIDELRNSTAK